METFGELLSRYRSKSYDPHRGRPLTQVSLGELIGQELGDMGFSGPAVSHWEHNKSKIAKDDRLVLVSLITVLHRYGGLTSIQQANELLRAGNYRDLDEEETLRAFPEMGFQPSTSQEPKNEEWTDSAEEFSGISIKERRKQLLLLEKVQRFWIDGVLNTSLLETSLINLICEHRDDLVSQPWAGVLGSPVARKPALSDTRSILGTYLVANRALLILGEPGAGKTITMLVLANELIKRARGNPSTPIPVILNVGSWVEGYNTISDWIIEELTSKYQIPRTIGRTWLEQDDLVVMLDGVDAVPEAFRAECFQAINDFRKVRGLTGIIVCSRRKEYERANQKLLLGGAIIIQPLDDRQITEYLHETGSPGITLEKILRTDPLLREIARSPLMLNAIVYSFGQNWEDLKEILEETSKEKKSDSVTWQQNVFELYVQRMFQSRGRETIYTQRQTELWLGWLARKMIQFNTPQLLLEQIQPTWLADRKWRSYYLTIVGVLTGIAGAIITWLLMQLIRLSVQLPAEVLAITVLNLILGLVVAFLQGRYFEKLHDEGQESRSRGRRYNKQLGTVGLIVGLITASLFAITGLPELVLIGSVSEVVIYVTMARYIYGRSYGNEIRTVEALAWSWQGAAKGFIAGTILMFVSEGIEMSLYQKTLHFESEYLLAAAGLVLGGIGGRKVADVGRLYQGIYLSLRNSIWAAIVSTVILGGLAYLIKFPEYAYYVTAIVFITSGGILGGNNVIKHLLVRSLLWLKGDLPWRLGKFLDYATSLAFLRKVGGAYIFYHRLLQDYFASHIPQSTEHERFDTLDTRGISRNLARGRK